MKGEDGQILYAGKAKNLNKRVRSYFEGGVDRRGGPSHHGGPPHHPREERVKIPCLERLVADTEDVVVGTEKEALGGVRAGSRRSLAFLPRIADEEP